MFLSRSIFHIDVTKIFILTLLLVQIVFSKRVTFENGQITYEYDDEHDCMYSGQFGNIYKGLRKVGIFTQLAVFKEVEPWGDAWKREINVYKKLSSHGSIPRFYDSFLKPNEDKAVLIMELLGLNLRELFDEYEYFSTPTVMRIGLQVLDALEYIHRKGVAHFDIHAGNIAVSYTNKSKIRVFDFGISHIDSRADERADDLSLLSYTLLEIAEGFPYEFINDDHEMDINRRKVIDEFISEANGDNPDIEALRTILITELEKHKNHPNYEKFEWELPSRKKNETN